MYAEANAPIWSLTRDVVMASLITAFMGTLIWSLLVFRVALALLTRTYFQPDEYFQALEPAHHAVFGYGHLTWEWSTAQPIRSIIYPVLYIPAYWFLNATGLASLDWALVRFFPSTVC